ncbi:MAG: ATP-binding protein [Byssovorax sp.]
MTALALSGDPPDDEDVDVRPASEEGPHSARYEIATLRQARSLARVLAARFPDPERVVVGLTELLVNAVEHGNLGIGFEEKARLLEHGDLRAEIERRLALEDLGARRVRVTFTRDADRAAATIEDEGEGFDWAPFAEYDPERMLESSGHGIAIARGMSFDEVSYQGKGNVVIAAVRIGADAESGAVSGEVPTRLAMR